MGLLGAMKLVLEGFDTTVYSRTPAASDLQDLVTAFGAKFVHAETATLADLAAQTWTSPARRSTWAGTTT